MEKKGITLNKFRKLAHKKVELYCGCKETFFVEEGGRLYHKHDDGSNLVFVKKDGFWCGYVNPKDVIKQLRELENEIILYKKIPVLPFHCTCDGSEYDGYDCSRWENKSVAERLSYCVGFLKGILRAKDANKLRPNKTISKLVRRIRLQLN